MPALYYRIQSSGPIRGGISSKERLTIGTKEVTSKYDQHYDSDGTCYFIYSITAVTFDKPADFDTATYEIDHGSEDHQPVKAWRTTFVDDNFVIPGEFRPDGLPSFFQRSDNGLGFKVDNVSFSFSRETWADFDATAFCKLANSATLESLKRMASDLGFGKLPEQIDNAKQLKALLDSVMLGGLGLVSEGMRGISDPNFDAAAYDKAVDTYLRTTRDGAFKTLETIKTFSDPIAEKAFDQVIRGQHILATITDEGSVPFDAAATVGLEFDFGGVLKTGISITGSARADVIVAGEKDRFISGGEGNDIIVGSRGGSTIRGGSGSDRLYGDAGVNVFEIDMNDRGADDRDHVVGGRDFDMFKVLGSDVGVMIDAAARRLTDIGGTVDYGDFRNVEAYSIAAAGSRFQGSAASETVEGLGADLVADMGAGNDTVVMMSGGAMGGKGTDLLAFEPDQSAVPVEGGIRSFDGYTMDTGLGTVADPDGVTVSSIWFSGFESYSANGQVSWKGSAASETFNIVGGGNVDGGGGVDTVVFDGSLDLMTGNAVTRFDGSRFKVKDVRNAELAGSGGTLKGTDGANKLAGGSIGVNSILGRGGDDALSGGTLADILSGGSGKDILDGGEGADRLSGGDGVDTASYASTAAGVTVNLAKTAANTGDAAGDTFSSIENLRGSLHDDILIGDGKANALTACDGNDRLYGAGGNDTLWGGAGKDAFVFDRKADGRSNVDVIADFSVKDDTIWLDDAVFKAFKTPARLSDDAFWKSRSGLAHDDGDRVIYETDTGKLFYDYNGSKPGGGVQIATLSKNLALTEADFIIV